MTNVSPEFAASLMDELLGDLARRLGVAQDSEQILLAIDDLIADRDLWKQRANVEASFNAAAVAKLRALEAKVGGRG